MSTRFYNPSSNRMGYYTNHLMLLGKTFDNVDLVHKILRSLTKEWEPKVIIIKESLKIQMPIIQELYGNLREHELKLKRY